MTGLSAGKSYNVEIYADVIKADGEVGEMMNYAVFETLGDGNTAVVNDPVQDTNVTPGTTQQPGTQPVTQVNPVMTTSLLPAPTIVSVTYENDSVYASTTNYGAAQGMEFNLFNKDGVLIATDDSLYNSGSFFEIKPNCVYYVQARGYIYDSNYNKLFSEWSAAKYVMPQPKATSKRKWIKRRSVKVKWSKVSGADNYIVYARKHNAKKWSKVGTTSKTSFTVKKIKGKKIMIGSKGYDIMVVAQGKIGGATLKSSGLLYVNVWII